MQLLRSYKRFLISNMNHYQELSFQTVPALWKQRSGIFKSNEIDLLDTRIDSAGIAFLVQWSKALNGQKLKIKNAPDNAINLIKTYRLTELFEIE